MFDWILAIPLWFSNAPAQEKDFIGVVAAEAAYAALLPDQAPVKPKVPTKDCTTCKGTGKITHGDGHETPCPHCDPTLGTSSADITLSPSVIEEEPPQEKASGFPARPLPIIR